MMEKPFSNSLPSVSVLVTSFNHKKILQNLLPQLLSEEYPKELFEAIIIDGGSEDGTREWLTSLQSSQIRVILQEGNNIRSSTRNDGIRSSQADILIMLDGDHTIEKNFIIWHAKQHQKRECIVVGQSEFSHNWRYRALFHYLNTRGAKKLPANHPLPGRYFLTRNCSMPRKVFEKVGFFSEEFTGWGGEDLELGVRFEEAAIPIVFESHARAYHHHHRPLKPLLKNLELYGEKSVPLLLKKHPQLYRELNLHRLEKIHIRLLMTGAVYHPILALTNLLLPFYVPPIVFDYLHLRQYGKGYLKSQKSLSKGELCRKS
ncbi:glycosyltransferase [bacterium]|nr:glycosyltransferase [bacterium]